MNKWKAGIYLRLSSDDGDKIESNSITNQKNLIKLFVNRNKDISIKVTYIDDGYSGTDFERPDFKRMIIDIEKGKIDTIIVKDLSRFGRNYIESGRYIEKIFPMLGVRFIAINDNYDSLTGKSQTDEIVIPFKNLINDAYCRDISIKIRSHLDVKRRKGEFIGSFTIYGYAKDEHDHNKIVIDEYAAGVVRDIYQWKISGMSQQRIADKLNDMGVLSPAEYKKSCGIKYSANLQTKKQAIWSAVAITRILTNESYTGTLIQGKVTTPNYKVKKTVIKDEEDWAVIPNAFEAIITKEQFDMVQEILKKDTRVAPDKKSVYLFSGIAVCGDCGRQMSRKVSTVSGKKYVYYMCSANKKEGVCSSHRIREDELEKAVVTYLNSYIDELARINKNCTQEQMAEKLKVSVYEDLKDELISKEEYISMKQEFENRRRAALDSIAQIKIEIETLASRNGKHHEWIESFIANKGIEKLERNVVVELIDYIKIYEDKRIEIVFRYADNYKEILNQIRYIQDNKNEMQEVS